MENYHILEKEFKGMMIMARNRGIRASMMQWAYKNKKLDDTLCHLQQSVDQLTQLVNKKQKNSSKSGR